MHCFFHLKVYLIVHRTSGFRRSLNYIFKKGNFNDILIFVSQLVFAKNSRKYNVKKSALN